MWSIYTQWNITQPSERTNTHHLLRFWMELEGIMLSEVSQSEKGNHHMVLLIQGIQEIVKGIIKERRGTEWGKIREGDKP